MALMPSYRRGLQQQDPSPYYSPAQAQRTNFQDYFNANQTSLAQGDFNPQTIPEYDWAVQALEEGQAANQLASESAINAANNAAAQAAANLAAQNSGFNFGGTSGGGNGSPNLRAVLRALGAQESGNNYSAVNADSGAMGRWQVMPANIAGSGGWDMEALGRNISTEQFQNSRALQNAIVRYKFGNYLKNYGLRGALSAWYSGDPDLWNNQDSQGNYPSIHDYVVEVLRRLGLA